MHLFPNNPRFQKAISQFDELNGRDPNLEVVNGVERARELLYAERLTEQVLQLNPNASEALLLAARSQHLCRWEIPRNTYPMNRPGYLKWRSDLKKMHAEKSGEVLRQAGYDDDMIQRVQSLNLKQDLKSDPDCQTLEDALCLLFLRYQLSELASRSTDEKMVNAIAKSWAKMSEQGRQAALDIDYGPKEKQLIDQALNG